MNNIPPQPFIDQLVDDLSKSINEEILYNIISPETKGLPIDQRRVIINRDQKINNVLGIDKTFTLDDLDITLERINSDSVDFKTKYGNKTFKIIKQDLSKPGFIFVPYIMSQSIQAVSDGSLTASSIVGRYAHKKINSNYYGNIY